MTDWWADRSFLRGDQYKTDVNLSARQSIYAYQHPRVDLAARVFGLAVPAPSDTIVDVGCGNGMYLAEVGRGGFGGRVLGVDLSSGMLVAARDRLAAAVKSAAFASANVTALPLRDGVADLTLAAHMLYYVPEPADALRELRRVTRSGGRVVIVLNGADHLPQLAAAIAAAPGIDLKPVGERVNLDDGEAIARDFFPGVARHDFVTELRVPAPDPIAAYVRSMSGTSRAPDPDHVVEAVVANFPRTPDGHYTMTTHTGCLICQV